MTGPGTSADQAEARVKAALGLSADLNLNTFDPIHALSTAGSDAAALASAARLSFKCGGYIALLSVCLGLRLKV